jgi:hypothetical protein
MGTRGFIHAVDVKNRRRHHGKDEKKAQKAAAQKGGRCSPPGTFSRRG